MKKTFFILTIIIFVLSFNYQVSANTTPKAFYHDTPYYYETIISNAPLSSSEQTNDVKASNNTITKTKTTKVRAQDGTLLWKVSITATFTYNGTTSYCTRCSHSAIAYASTWSIKSSTSYKSGNQATATATATHSNGNISNDYTKSVTIQCDKNGVVS